MPNLIQDESGYLQLDITGYPEDFNISFNVTGTFLGFSKISAKVVTAKDKTVQVLIYLKDVFKGWGMYIFFHKKLFLLPFENMQNEWGEASV